MTDDLNRLRHLAGLISESHVPRSGPAPATALDAHEHECEEDDCPRCNPGIEANDGELDETIADAYERFMTEDRKKKAEPVWENCPECGGSGMRGVMVGSGFRETPCHDCDGEGGWWVEPDDEDEKLSEQGEQEDVPGMEAEAGTGLIESGDPKRAAYAQARDLVSKAMDLIYEADPDESVRHVLDDAHSQLCYLAGDDDELTEARAERQSGGNVTLTMSVGEANKAAQALNHVGREVFDGEGDGQILIDLANQIRRCL